MNTIFCGLVMNVDEYNISFVIVLQTIRINKDTGCIQQKNIYAQRSCISSMLEQLKCKEHDMSFNVSFRPL